MIHNENNQHRCTGCGICEKACPNGTISVLTTKDLAGRKVLGRYIYRLSQCTLCNLCIESCPFGAIKKPSEPLNSGNKHAEIKRMAFLLVLLPLLVVAGGWVGSRLEIPLSRQHATVSLAEEVLLENSGKRQEMTDETKAFRASGKPTQELLAEARAIRRKFKIGGWFFGGFIGLILCLKLMSFSVQRRQPEYAIDKGTCLSCARCFAYCPYEKFRLGLIGPDELKEIETKAEKESKK